MHYPRVVELIEPVSLYLLPCLEIKPLSLHCLCFIDWCRNMSFCLNGPEIFIKLSCDFHWCKKPMLLAALQRKRLSNWKIVFIQATIAMYKQCLYFGLSSIWCKLQTTTCSWMNLNLYSYASHKVFLENNMMHHWEERRLFVLRDYKLTSYMAIADWPVRDINIGK